MTYASASCAQCGARLPAGAVRCDLCGTPVGATPSELDSAAPSAAPSPAGRVFCNQCGHANPAGSRFCSQCGARLEASASDAAAPAVVPATPPPADAPAPPPDAQKGLGAQVALIVGMGLVIVLVLYAITSISNGGLQLGGDAAEPAATERQAASPDDPRSAIEIHSELPLPEQIAADVQTLEADISAASGAERLAKQRELVTLLVGAGRPDRAAIVQQEIAQDVDTPAEWERAGNFFYDWMDQISGQHQAEVADLAIRAYQRVLEVQPENHDVRATMAVAYLYDPNNPMKAIEETNRVLEAEPDHVQANFNRGLMLMQINRFEQAVTQFERVQTLVEPTSPIYQQAAQVIATLRETQARQAQGAASVPSS